jgi:hypothetical protein
MTVFPRNPPPRRHWHWQRGGWLLVDRSADHITPINLPDFDPLYSVASGYRDYAAYCGVSDDGKKIYAMVAQLNRGKPVLKKPLSKPDLADDAPPDSACPALAWQRAPTQVSFESSGKRKADLRHSRTSGRSGE